MGEAAAEQELSAGTIRPSFDAGRLSLLWLALRMSVLTVLTLGLYRFWMATRLRRYYWNAIRILDDPLEYTGTPLEKLLGFLFALVILAIYLSLVNLGLAFIGLVSFEEPTGVEIQLVLNLSILASLPLLFFATYRARRYVLARTRWRGIRFGMDQAAWGFTWRAMLLSLASVVSLGLLYPLQNFRLIKFMVDRTWFGDAQFRQDGRWLGLLGYWCWVWIPGALLLGLVAALLSRPAAQSLAPAVAVAILGALFVTLAYVRYRVAAFRFLWAHRTVAGARFDNHIGAAEVIGIYFVGIIGVAFFSVLVSGVLTIMAMLVWLSFATAEQADRMWRLADGAVDPNLGWAVFGLMAFAYLSAIALSAALTQVFIVRPLLRRQAESMQIDGSGGLAAVRQREHDEAIEAGGFADALGVDVGAGV